jgi:hypothetical protein
VISGQAVRALYYRSFEFPGDGEPGIDPIVTLTKVRVHGRKRWHGRTAARQVSITPAMARILLRLRSWILTFVRMTAT